MPLALSLHFDKKASEAVKDVWKALSEAGVSSDMLKLAYPPHVTLLVVDDESLADKLMAGLPELAPRVPRGVRLGDVRQFPGTSVVWIECFGDLAAVHEAAARLVPLERIDPHYRPGAWTPHVTLQTTGNAGRAMAIAQVEWHAGVSSSLSKLEVVTFAPVKVIRALDVGLARGVM